MIDKVPCRCSSRNFSRQALGEGQKVPSENQHLWIMIDRQWVFRVKQHPDTCYYAISLDIDDLDKVTTLLLLYSPTIYNSPT